MKKNHFQRASALSIHFWSVLAFLVFSAVTVKAQEDAAFLECGTPEPTASQYEDYIGQLNTFYRQSSLASGASGSATHYYIGVDVYLINDDEGNPPVGVSAPLDALERLTTALNYVNENFHPQISFYVCQFEAINDTHAHNLQAPKSILAILANEHGISFKDNTINIFLNAELWGRGEFPAGIKVPAYSTDGPFLLHEFGHYFGLLHTHQSSYSSPLECVLLFPDHDPNDDCWTGFPSCENINYGHCYGDLIADTPVDVLDNACTSAHLIDAPCIREVNGEEYSYHPDYYNAMSSWQPTRRGLTAEQQQRVLAILENPHLGVPPLGGDMSALITSSPDCEEIEIIGMYPAAAGYVEEVKYDYGAEQYLMSPFKHGHVWIHQLSPSGTFAIKHLIRNGIYLTNAHNLNSTVARVDFSASFQDWPDSVQDDYLSPSYNVDVYDLIRIAKHILGIDELPKPYYWIAADANNSGTITALDLIQIQRVILGGSFSQVPSWRFVPKYALADPGFADDFFDAPFEAVWSTDSGDYGYLDGAANSYLGGVPNALSSALTNLLHFPIASNFPDARDANTWSFLAVKTGDVGRASEDLGTDFFLDIPAHPCLEAGKLATIKVKSSWGVEQLAGLQLAFDVAEDALTATRLRSGRDNLIGPDDFYFSEGTARLAWFMGTVAPSLDLAAGDVILELEIVPESDICDLRDVIKLPPSTFNKAVIARAAEGEKAEYGGLGKLYMELEVGSANQEERNRIMDVFPNPAGGNEVNIKLVLGAEAPVSVHLFDVFGNSSLVDFGIQAAGAAELPPISLQGLAPGFLFYTIHIGGAPHTGRLVKF